MPAWIDFKELRSKLRFEDVLRRYGVEVRRKGVQHTGPCPLPSHKGKNNVPAFSANLERGIFNCFGCGAKGNLLEFAALMERVDIEDGPALRRIAGELSALNSPRSAHKKLTHRTPADPACGPSRLPAALVNSPLDFELKGLDPLHPYFRESNLRQDTVDHFGLGYCSRGSMKGRIAIRLDDEANRLVGYAGLAVDLDPTDRNRSKYLFPTRREREGHLFEFRTALFLYNGVRIESPVEELIVVEEIASVWWLHQNGLPNTVATMAAECSDEQAAIISSLVERGGRVWVVTGANPAWGRFVESCLRAITPTRFVRWVRLPKGTEPTDLAADDLRAQFDC